MKPLINLISRMFLALALCVSAPAAFAGDSSYDIDKERIAQEIREKAMSGDLDGATEAVETYEDSFLAEVKLLIANGVDVNKRDEEGRALLHYAAHRKNEGRAAELLLDNGADIEAKDEGGWGWGFAPLHYAVSSRWIYIGLFLEESGPHNSFEVANVLLKNGAEVNAKAQYDETPLHVASSAEFAKLLIEYDANVHARSEGGWTPLHGAAQRNSEEVAAMLLKNGADIEAKSNIGWTPLHSAADDDGVEVAELLIAKGADVNAKDNDGQTPLHIAALYPTPREDGESEEEIIMALIRHGADVNAQTTKDHYLYGAAGSTPLDYAMWLETRYRVSTIELLIANGARCNVKTWELCPEPVAPPEPQADYTGLYANAAFAVAGAFAPSWVDTQTFAFNQGDKLVTGQSLSVPLDDFTFAAKRVQVNDLTDYEFSVKWEMEF